MNYKEDKRTKNLSLRDIHVGDWVQAWDEITKRYTPPERITGIFDDGTVYTMVDPEQGDPFEYDISEIDAIPIDENILKGFGFTIGESNEICGGTTAFIFYKNIHIGHLYKFNNGHTACTVKGMDCSYMHEFCAIIYDLYSDLKLEWRGVEKNN